MNGVDTSVATSEVVLSGVSAVADSAESSDASTEVVSCSAVDGSSTSSIFDTSFSVAARSSASLILSLCSSAQKSLDGASVIPLRVGIGFDSVFISADG